MTAGYTRILLLSLLLVIGVAFGVSSLSVSAESDSVSIVITLKDPSESETPTATTTDVARATFPVVDLLPEAGVAPQSSAVTITLFTMLTAGALLITAGLVGSSRGIR